MLIKNYKFSVLTSIILPFLITPYILKEIYKKEPYPAVIFPSGPSKVKIDNHKIIIIRRKLYGKKIGKGNRWVELPYQKFCKPLSVNFCRYLVNTKFGQKKLARQSKIFSFVINLPEKITDKEIELSKDYFKTRLVSLGFKKKQIMYRSEKISYDPKSNQISLMSKTSDLLFNFD